MKNLFQHSHKFSKGLFVNFSLQNKYDHESFIIALVPKRLKLIYLPLSTNYGAPQWALLQYIMDKVDFRSMRKTTKHLSFFLSFLPPSISFDEKKKIRSKDFLCFFSWNVLLWSNLILCRNAFWWEKRPKYLCKNHCDLN